MPDGARTAAELVRRLLDRGYTGATDAVIRAIVRNGSTGAVGKRLQDLEAEAARLAAAGERLSPDNPVVRALMADFEDAMRANRALVASASDDVQRVGIDAAGRIVRQMALPGWSDDMLAAIGVRWNQPDPEAVARLVDYVRSEPFLNKLRQYETGTLDRAQGVLVRTFVQGYGPRRAAGELRMAVQGMPSSYAHQVLRTLQLTALRDAQVTHRVANAGILEYQVRIAALDDRTCMACVAQHGEILPIDARIDDHHLGRCTSITKVRWLDAPTVTSGPEWFATLPEDTQRERLGGARYDALKAGAIRWQDIPRPYQDDTWGRMVGEASLKGMLGADAQAYYSR